MYNKNQKWVLTTEFKKFNLTKPAFFSSFYYKMFTPFFSKNSKIDYDQFKYIRFTSFIFNF